MCADLSSATIEKFGKGDGEFDNPNREAMGISMWLTVGTIESKSLCPRGSS